MKLAPISVDLLLKLALIAGGIGLVVYLVRRASGAVSGAVDTVVAGAQHVADAVITGVNPTNPQNWAYSGANAVGATVVSDTGPGRNADGSWTVGGWLYDVTHPDPVYGAGTGSGATPVFSPTSNELISYSGSPFEGRW